MGPSHVVRHRILYLAVSRAVCLLPCRFMYYAPSWAFHRDVKEPFPLNFVVDFKHGTMLGRLALPLKACKRQWAWHWTVAMVATLAAWP